MNLPDNNIIIVNNTGKYEKGMTATVSYYGIDGKPYYTKSVKLDAPANSKTDCFIPEPTKDNSQLTLARVELKNSKGKVVSINDYWKNSNDLTVNKSLNNLDPVKLSVSIKTLKDGKKVVEVMNPTETIAAAIKLNAVDQTSNEIILPAYFSDGYFNLLPREKRSIELELPINISNIKVITDGYNIIK